MRCIVCKTELNNLDEDGVQPDDGVEFSSFGHYGSTVFDPMDGTFLSICVCDDCIKNNIADIQHGHPTGDGRPEYKPFR